MRHLTPYNVLLIISLVMLIIAWANELKRLKFIAIGLVFFVAACLLSGCGVTARTPYGDFSYDQPAKVSDGKTMLR